MEYKQARTEKQIRLLYAMTHLWTFNIFRTGKFIIVLQAVSHIEIQSRNNVSDVAGYTGSFSLLNQ
jgi:hypothetical protein